MGRQVQKIGKKPNRERERERFRIGAVSAGGSHQGKRERERSALRDRTVPSEEEYMPRD